ncbi:hypothetical protein SAMN04487897_101516 [Paenibacillus sp. yr247]|nr:hypothetical protein [Paenibacillus sp. yr247]SDM92884.1 hypothetical protein SAMN04487897_101516 [Paenibacillus sp. yr247]
MKRGVWLGLLLLMAAALYLRLHYVLEADYPPLEWDQLEYTNLTGRNSVPISDWEAVVSSDNRTYRQRVRRGVSFLRLVNFTHFDGGSVSDCFYRITLHAGSHHTG